MKCSSGVKGRLASLFLLASALSLTPFAFAQENLEDERELTREDRGVVDEIVVTIRKRAENVQEVPASITGLSAQQIEEANIQSAGDLVTLIPNTTVKSEGGPITIRGISQSFSSQSPVAEHINGVFKFTDGLFGQFYDLQNIDVARGPSGTIYGRNATAGAINVVWRKPHDQFEVFGDATVGNFNRLDFRGGFNVPFFGNDDDRLMGRFAMQKAIRDGYQDNLLEPSRRKDPAALDLWHLRGSLLANPLDTVSVEWRGYWTENTASFAAAKPFLDPYPTNGILDLGPPIGQVPSDPYAGALPIPSNPRDVLSLSEQTLGRGFNRFWATDGELNWDMGELPLLGETEFTILGGLDWKRSAGVSDADGSELVILDTIQDDSRNGSTFDLRFASAGDESWTWMLGFFWFENNLDRFQRTGTPFGFVESFTLRDNSGFAPYLNLTWEVFDRFELFGGFRWNEDTVDVDIENLPLFIGPIEAIAGAQIQGSQEFSEPTGEFGFKVRTWDENIFYAKYARGYKAGNIELLSENVVGDGVSCGTDCFVNLIEPEKINSVEAGVKNRLWDDKLTLNFTGFWYGYTDLQVPQILGLNVVTTNAAAATIWGLELEAAATPVDNWYISGTVSYLNSQFDEFCANDAAQFLAVSDPGCPPGTPPSVPGDVTIDAFLDLSGNTPEDSPEWKISLFTNYDLDLGKWGVLTPILKFTWTDSYFLRPFNCGSCGQSAGVDAIDGFTRTDLRLHWRSETGGLTAELFVENVENNAPYQRVIVGPQFTGGAPSRFGLAQPRLYGFRLGFTWEGL